MVLTGGRTVLLDDPCDPPLGVTEAFRRYQTQIEPARPARPLHRRSRRTRRMDHRRAEGNKIGDINKNTSQGIFGTVSNNYVTANHLKALPVGLKQEIKIGPATILSCVDNEVKEYGIQIEKIDLNSQSPNKGMVIKITDDKLLEMTGGIVQGMSGSPIIQNGKIIGAVTHVFIQDSTKGYGTFIENMINNLEDN